MGAIKPDILDIQESVGYCTKCGSEGDLGNGLCVKCWDGQESKDTKTPGESLDWKNIESSAKSKDYISKAVIITHRLIARSRMIPKVNLIVVRCRCGFIFQARDSSARVRCPHCKARWFVNVMKKSYSGTGPFGEL